MRPAHFLRQIGDARGLVSEPPEINQDGCVGDELHEGGSVLRVAKIDCSSSPKSDSDKFGRTCEASSAAVSVLFGGIILSMTSEKVAPSFHARSR